MIKFNQYIDAEVDKLTNSMENIFTGNSFQTDISLITSNDLKHVNKKNDWVFNWKTEYDQPDRDVYKVTIVNNPTRIQGLVSLSDKTDHVYLHLIERAPLIKVKTKFILGYQVI